MGCQGCHPGLPEIMVVVPKSVRADRDRVGKAYAISDVITASYFYPKGRCNRDMPLISPIPLPDEDVEPHGLTGDIASTSRSLRDGETMEWMLITGVSIICSTSTEHSDSRIMHQHRSSQPLPRPD